MFRRFDAEQAIEIIKSVPPHASEEGRLLGLEAIQVVCDWFPKATEDRREGMTVLQSLPAAEPIPPQVFFFYLYVKCCLTY
jgi:hypothetical protein